VSGCSQVADAGDVSFDASSRAAGSVETVLADTGSFSWFGSYISGTNVLFFADVSYKNFTLPANRALVNNQVISISKSELVNKQSELQNYGAYLVYETEVWGMFGNGSATLAVTNWGVGGTLDTVVTGYGAVPRGKTVRVKYEIYYNLQSNVTLNTVAITEKDNGSAQFSITLAGKRDTVHLFAKKNGLQDFVALDLQNSGTANADGTYTYSVVRNGAYNLGDKIEARFFTYTPALGQVNFPGPSESQFSPAVVYGKSSVEATAFKADNGDLVIKAAYSNGAQANVEVFVKKNGEQIIAQKITTTQTVENGVYVYTLTIPAASLADKDNIEYRFYSYVQGGNAFFAPGPAEQVWYTPYVYAVNAE
jgi:hypothetical protein